MQASHLTPKMCLNLCLFCFFYCHIWKLIIQCPNISCHLCCDKINNSSNWNQTNATFSCWMRNILCCVCEPKFGETHHFILNEIIFNQLIYNFILFTVFEITSKGGFCTVTQVLFLQHIFSRWKEESFEKARNIHSLLYPFLLVMLIQISGLFFFFFLFWEGILLFPELLGMLWVLLLSAGAAWAPAEGEGISKCGEQPVLNLQRDPLGWEVLCKCEVTVVIWGANAPWAVIEA